MLLIITSTGDRLFGFINIDDLERPWTLKILILSDFLAIFGCKRVNCDEMDGDRLRLLANRNCYRLSGVSWALLKLLVRISDNVSRAANDVRGPRVWDPWFKRYSSFCETHLGATKHHLPYGITQFYLQPNTGERASPKPQPDRIQQIHNIIACLGVLGI